VDICYENAKKLSSRFRYLGLWALVKVQKHVRVKLGDAAMRAFQGQMGARCSVADLRISRACV
jgi:hypothetical protein